ncbi:MAG: hypothetical protein EAZ92_14860 [Candidatus Kapaibacterium sp.]|nr:MAG: hypothetical protein EAZ92_14860 [Candidatus Kapabacteria bacterium]
MYRHDISLTFFHRKKTMLIQVRTKDSLTTLLKHGCTGDWIIGKHKTPHIKRIRVVAFSGTTMFEADVLSVKPHPTLPGRFIVCFNNPSHVSPCNVEFTSRNPVTYPLWA